MKVHLSAYVNDIESVIKEILPLRSAGKTVITTNGCFDLLHRGLACCEKLPGLPDPPRVEHFWMVSDRPGYAHVDRLLGSVEMTSQKSPTHDREGAVDLRQYMEELAAAFETELGQFVAAQAGDGLAA